MAVCFARVSHNEAYVNVIPPPQSKHKVLFSARYFKSLKRALCGVITERTYKYTLDTGETHFPLPPA